MAIYDRSKSSAELFLEDTQDLDVFKVTLVEGTYGHTGHEVKQGEFTANLSVGGTIHGHVLTSMADSTPEGQPASVTLTLKAE